MKNFWSLSLAIVCLFWISVLAEEDKGYTGQELGNLVLYPDIRAEYWDKQCGPHVPQKSYVCDPDEIIGESDVIWLNQRLRNLQLVKGGKKNELCKCQRIGQCNGEDEKGEKITIGFIIAVAFARRIYAHERPPSKNEALRAARQFSKQLMGRWALGDCGNFVIIIVWTEQKFLYIHPADRLAAKFITEEEKTDIMKKVERVMANGEYMSALKMVLDDLETEIKGLEVTRVDIGFYSLILSVAVALVFVVLITGFVCAFRCCGNLRPDTDTVLGQTLDRVDMLKREVIKRGSSLRRSLSRSPKTPHHEMSYSPKSPRLDHTAPLIQSSSGHQGSPGSGVNRQLLAMPVHRNMARLASPYYGSQEDGLSMV